MILDELAANARARVEDAKKTVSEEDLKAAAFSLPKGNFRFERTLSQPGTSFICEVKKASPSKGIIAEDFPYVEIAREYEAAGADCISVLTEPRWFLGSDSYLKEIRQTVSLPILRKDFTVNAYQIYEAKVLGADAVLLICALLDKETIRSYLALCDQLGITALVETHDEEEIASAVTAGARVIGVNNRSLKDFTVDFANCSRLRTAIPDHALFVAESGVKTAADVSALKQAGADAILIGEAFMKSENKRAMLEALKSAAERSPL